MLCLQDGQVHRFADGHRQVAHEAVVPSLGEGDVESGVEGVEGIRLHGVVHLPEQVGGSCQRSGGADFCCRSAGRHLQGHAGFGEVGEGDDVEGQLQTKDAAHGVGGVGVDAGSVASAGA